MTFTLIVSFITLLWAANHLVTGATGIAVYYKLSPLVIGLTLVAIGTSLPEIMVAITAASEGRSELALGNAIGANIANIGLVLGLTILLRPLTIKSSFLRREYPLLFLVMLFTYSLMIDTYLTIVDGCLLLVACVGLIVYFVHHAHLSKKDALSLEFKQTLSIKRPMKANITSLLIGLLILPLSSHFLVNSAIDLAHILGMSDLVMGLTVIAIGACIPNIATSLVAAYKGQDDIAIGNILGSNMFNLLVVMAFPAIINPSQISHALLWRDIPVMFIITLVLLFFSYYYKKKIERWHGGLLLLIYVSYITSLMLNAIFY
ncbi:MAG: calcium/sodium antiporter [Legionellales bacterium]|nr:calcium/sodium antiporter [Legionellales bacterium]